MTPAKGNVFAVLSLILVLVLPLGLILKAMNDRESGTVWTVKIGGYDPIHPLYGHYLNFVYEWDMADRNNCMYGKNCCICLTAKGAGNHVNPDAETYECDKPPQRQCDSIIRDKGRTLSGGQQYYIPEDHATMIEDLLRRDEREFSMEIAVPPGGGAPVIRGLAVDGKPLRDFLLTYKPPQELANPALDEAAPVAAP